MGRISAVIVLLLAVASFFVIVSLPAYMRPVWLFIVPIILFVLTFIALER